MDIIDIIKQIHKEADERERIAGLQGAMNDGGATTLRGQIEFFEYGLKGTLPPQWEKYKVKLDPEYQEYLRLKEKFKNQ